MSDSLIRVEYNTKPSRTIRVYRCAASNCSSEVRIREDSKNTHSGMCQMHSHRKRPYESIYNSFQNDWRKLENSITYEQFLEFTNVLNCCYCNDLIPWSPYSIHEGKFGSRAYFLDRKDNSQGYSKGNCVVCCTECNKIKGNYFTHDEMLVAMKAVLEYREAPTP